ncbi:hypothetical protein AAW18_12370 [Xanthomonas campestris pv. campestris]|nr:hypothetical protein AEA00_08100 [Xanthomonas campestris pv. campestris]AKS19909.1 hypothetical protein AEA01_08130 [Xanthomonas campestris pv. campestris]ALE69184.1 hypothetical protein AAW18_12370 [Xanthomonas campestris pv. campestris]
MQTRPAYVFNGDYAAEIDSTDASSSGECLRCAAAKAAGCKRRSARRLVQPMAALRRQGTPAQQLH